VRRSPKLIRIWIEASLALILGAAAFVVPGSVGRSAGDVSPPPPTAVNGSPSPFPTSLATPTPSVAPPSLTAATAVLEHLDGGQTLFSKAARARRPIASLTKIMTALVVMTEAGPDEIVAVSGNAASQSGSSLGLLAGERITVRHLLYALLLQSSNDAAVALAEHVGGSVGGFLALMNRTARQLGMTDSFFTSPSGLDDRGYSSARDLAIVTREVYGQPLFEKIVKTKFHDVPSPSGPPRHIQNRNILLWLYPGAIGVKTGFTTPAGHCLIAAADRDGVRLLVVALGSGGADAAGVFNDGAALLNYGYSAFRLETLIHAGDALGPFTVDGASVPAVAATSLIRLVRLDLIDKVTIDVRMDAGLSLPVGAGDKVGRVSVSVDGKRAGVVDAVATGSVATDAPSPAPPSPSHPPAAPAGSWGRLVDAFRDLVRAVVGPFL
jgi:D-alanyl-D-alanine carboxypeptidase (penicillin-binding protein 5/6)